MSVDNLAMVFAPTLFQNCADKKYPSLLKRIRSISQENLLKDFKKNNDLQTAVIKLLIQNAERIGTPKNIYIPSRRPSDLKYNNAKSMEDICEIPIENLELR